MALDMAFEIVVCNAELSRGGVGEIGDDQLGIEDAFKPGRGEPGQHFPMTPPSLTSPREGLHLSLMLSASSFRNCQCEMPRCT